jgi:hypothetical protein
MKKLTCFVIVAVAAALGTWMLGWWAIPVVALIAGLMRCRASIVSAASATAWLMLLAIDAASGSIGTVGTVLTGVMRVPAIGIYALTILLPALLGWSAASLGNAALSLRPTSRQPS